jgi:FkbM family methyltransferase
MNAWAAAYTWYLRRPEHRAKRRLERLLARALPADGIVAEVSHRVRLRLHPRDWIEYVLLRDGAYEPLTLTFLERNLAPGDGAALAGVNFGLHVVVASRAVGPLGRVLGADPQPSALERTAEHLALNGCPANTRLLPVALGRAEHVVPLGPPPPDNAGLAHLRTPGSGPICAPVLTVSHAWQQAWADPRPPRLALIDVEGYESEVLAGFGDRFRPELLVIEEYDEFLRPMGSSSADLRQRLADLGYALATLTGQPLGDSSELPEHNIVAVHATCERMRYVESST